MSKILVLGRTMDMGGTEVAMAALLQKLVEKKEDVTLLLVEIGPVDLVDDDNDLVSKLQRLLQHEACLRHRTFESIHKQNASIRHIQYTFHFTSEVTVSRSINNVNLGVFVVDRNVL